MAIIHKRDLALVHLYGNQKESRDVGKIRPRSVSQKGICEIIGIQPKNFRKDSYLGPYLKGVTLQDPALGKTVYFSDDKGTWSSGVIKNFKSTGFREGIIDIKLETGSERKRFEELYEIPVLISKRKAYWFDEFGFQTRSKRDTYSLNIIGEQRAKEIIDELEKGKEVFYQARGGEFLSMNLSDLISGSDESISYYKKAKRYSYLINAIENGNYGFFTSLKGGKISWGELIEDSFPPPPPDWEFQKFCKRVAIIDWSIPFNKQMIELFVPPNNYDEIKNTLDEHNYVIISGPGGMGRTYITKYLLFDYWSKNQYHSPYYFPRTRIEQAIEAGFFDISDEKKIVALDGPFGTEASAIGVPKLDEILRNIFSGKHTNIKLILSSRNSVLKFDELDLKRYKINKKINIVDLNSYKGKLPAIYNKYISFHKPAWSNEPFSKDARKLILSKYINPHNIESLIKNTCSINDWGTLNLEIDSFMEIPEKFKDILKFLIKSGNAHAVKLALISAFFNRFEEININDAFMLFMERESNNPEAILIDAKEKLEGWIDQDSNFLHGSVYSGLLLSLGLTDMQRMLGEMVSTLTSHVDDHLKRGVIPFLVENYYNLPEETQHSNILLKMVEGGDSLIRKTIGAELIKNINKFDKNIYGPVIKVLVDDEDQSVRKEVRELIEINHIECLKEFICD